jgi:hypothetical protein
MVGFAPPPPVLLLLAIAIMDEPPPNLGGCKYFVFGRGVAVDDCGG